MAGMSIHSDNPDHGFQFPGDFELSAMGAADAGLLDLVPDLLEAEGLLVYRDSARVRPSAKGNYVSVTIRFQARDRAEHDAAHEALRAHPAIKWTL